MCFRIGRTGRAGRAGTATTFFTPQDAPKAAQVSNVMALSGQDVPPWLGTMALASSSTASHTLSSDVSVVSREFSSSSSSTTASADASSVPSGGKFKRSSQGETNSSTSGTSQVTGVGSSQAKPSRRASSPDGLSHDQGGGMRWRLRVRDIAEAKGHPFGRYMHHHAGGEAAYKRQSASAASSLAMGILQDEIGASLLQPVKSSSKETATAAHNTPMANEAASAAATAALLARWHAVIHGSPRSKSTTVTADADRVSSST